MAIVMAPALDEDLGFKESVEDLAIEQFSGACVRSNFQPARPWP